MCSACEVYAQPPLHCPRTIRANGKEQGFAVPSRFLLLDEKCGRMLDDMERNTHIPQQDSNGHSSKKQGLCNSCLLSNDS
jgi:hypothetical protein